jgi:gallate decarboxylase subunit D
MAATNVRTKAVVWDPAALPGLVRVGRGRLAVTAAVQAVGRDLLVTVTGGQAHAGATAVVAPPAGRRRGFGRLAVVPPHKEGPLAEAGALQVARAAGCTCVCVAGIHQDAATPTEIAAIVGNATAAIDRLAEMLARVPVDQRYCRASVPKPSTP